MSSKLSLGLFLLLCLLFVPIYSQTGWFDVNANVSDDLYSIFFLNTNTGYICGNSGRLLKSINAGQNWDTLNTPNYSHNLYSIYFINQFTGLVVGQYCLYKTTNSGINWTFLSAFNSFNAKKITFINENTGFAVGNYKMGKTTNAGASWEFISYSDDYLIDIFFINNLTGYLVNDPIMRCEILKTTNAGINWYLSYNIDCYACRSVHHPNENFRYIIGSDCYITNYVSRFYGTSNGGAYWFNTNLGENRFYGIYFTSSLTGYASGDNGIILKTADGGLNWHNQTSGIGGPPLYIVLFLNENTGFVIGGNGKIKKTTNGGGPIGINKISNEIPIELKLYQNYPNPFNPVTKIRFSLTNPLKGEIQDVRLVIYDILGREISTLVNEKLSAGIYQIEFDGSQYSSGIYFYRLKHGDIVFAKKMVLIK